MYSKTWSKDVLKMYIMYLKLFNVYQQIFYMYTKNVYCEKVALCSKEQNQ